MIDETGEERGEELVKGSMVIYDVRLKGGGGPRDKISCVSKRQRERKGFEQIQGFCGHHLRELPKCKFVSGSFAFAMAPFHMF